MTINEMLGARFFINDKNDYQKFLELGDKIGLTWADGSEMDSSTGVAIGGEHFPFVLEISKNGDVMFDHHLAGATNFKTACAPKTENSIALLTNKKNPGITVTLDDGREFVYDVEDALNKPTSFNNWLKDITRPPIKVNDFVELVDVGQLYSTYFAWFKENNVDIDIAARYAYVRESYPSTCGYYRVLAIGKHIEDDSITIYAIAEEEDYIQDVSPVYLVNNRGIKKI